MIVFVDLDGTIIDSFYRHYILLKDILNKYNLNVNFVFDDYFMKKRNGLNNLKYLKNVLNISEDLSKKIQKEWVDKIESEDMLSLDKIFDDSIVFLDFLKKKDYKIVFLTARTNKELTMFQLEKFGILKYATKVIVVEPKNGDVNKCNAINKEKIDECIVVGDTEVDYKAAEKSNIKSYILNRGFRTKEFLNSIGVNNSYDDLYKIMEEIDDKKLQNGRIC